MRIEDLAGKKILIVGYGAEGKATDQYLRANLRNPQITITDRADGENYLQNQFDYDIAIRSPGVPVNLIKIPHTTATNLFFSAVTSKYKTIGVTGSKGKSTTASLIHHMLVESQLKTHLVGNIGNPMLAELLQPISNTDIFVCELSSFQLSDIEYSPNISIITSLFPEHMNYHGGIEQYYQSKKNIIAHVRPEDYFIYNPLFPQLAEWAENAVCKSIPYDEMLKIDVQKIPLIGDHNRANIRAAITVGRLLQIPQNVITRSIYTFKPLRHRLENIGEFRGITFYDDAISTTPESTIAALESLQNISVIMLGGLDRGYDFEELAAAVVEKNIPFIVLFPNSGERIAAAITKYAQAHSKKSPDFTRVNTMEEAIQQAYLHAKPGSICLLSCASPSYSLWKNFEEKGDEFRKFSRQGGLK